MQVINEKINNTEFKAGLSETAWFVLSFLIELFSGNEWSSSKLCSLYT